MPCQVNHAFPAAFSRQKILVPVQHHHILNILSRVARQPRKLRRHPPQISCHSPQHRPPLPPAPLWKRQPQIKFRGLPHLRQQQNKQLHSPRSQTPRHRPRQHPQYFHKRPSHGELDLLGHSQVAKPFLSAGAKLPLLRLPPASKLNRQPTIPMNPPLPTFQDTPTMLSSSFRDPNQRRNPRIPAAFTHSAPPLDRTDLIDALPLLFPQSRRARPPRPRRASLRVDRPRYAGNG